MKRLAIICWALSCLGFGNASAQVWGLKTNVLYDATATINLGTEFKVANRQTIDLSGNLNLWTWSDNRKMKHWLLQPEWRYWLCTPFNRSFLGLHVHGGQFNFNKIKGHRYEGWLVGAGVTYGYHWILSNRWNLEAAIGVGYAYLDYKKFACDHCGQKLKDDHRHYVGPTKASLSLIYLLK